MSEIIFCAGPFVGDFKTEITNFLPKVKWLSSIVEYDKIFINTHSNRFFLYNFIPKENLIPIYEGLTRDELLQKGNTHGNINIKEFRYLIQVFIDSIIKKTKCNKNDVIQYQSKYKKVSLCDYFKKDFSALELSDLDFIPPEKDYIVFIPHNEKEKKLEKIYNRINKYQKCIIIGDMEALLPEKNIVIQNIDYFSNGYKYILSYIKHAKAVICPLSYINIICNVNKIPVFSWGEGIGPFKKDGIYNFNNKNSMVVPNNSVDNLIESFKYFMKGIEQC